MSIKAVVNSGRRLVATTLLDRARIHDRTVSRDTTGGQVEVWTPRTKVTRCRFTRPKDDEATAQLDSVYGPTEQFLLLPVGTVVKEGSRIVDQANQKIWVVTADVTVVSELGIVTRLGIRELDS